ncbi:MAG: inorganic phosphate transporter [Acidobacteriaceae bacterium]
MARAMIQTFGKGLLAPGTRADFAAAFATVAGAALFVGFSTIRRLPVSTTHAIVGSVAGVGAVAYGVSGINWPGLWDKIALPLLLSPFVALALTAILLQIWGMIDPAMEKDCLCAEVMPPMVHTACYDGAVALASAVTDALPEIHITACKADTQPSPRITVAHLHWLSSGATSFARGMNDTPKMVAILMSAALLSKDVPVTSPVWFGAIVFGIVLGSWVAGRPVTEMLAADVTRMNHREGFTAKLVTAVLVASGAALGWPMSTTQVASGAIIGIASTGKQTINWRSVRAILIAWAVTLPGAAILGIASYALLRTAGIQ